MSSDLEVKINVVANSSVLTFAGQINEDADFSAVNITTPEVVFDLQNVSHLNSCGIREWINFQNDKVSGKKVTYKNCPQVIVEQMNIVKGFVIEGGTIESFYAPYYNEKDDSEIKLLITPSEVVNRKAPSKNIDGVELEFDDIEAQYFSFLSES